MNDTREAGTAIYRLFAADGTYLYGGVTTNPRRPVSAHLRKTSWWPTVARREVTWFASRAEATEAEATFGRGVMARGYRPSPRFPHSPRCAHKAYHMSCAEYEELLSRCGYRCWVCGEGALRGDTGLVLDHNHTLGFRAVRGLVCHSCNALIHQVDIGKRLPSGKLADLLANPWHATAGIQSYECPPDCRYGSHARARKWASSRR